MPILLLLLAVPFVVLLVLLLIPFGVVRRYQTGKARQRARAWLSTLNVLGYGFSAFVLVASAAVTGIWDGRALPFTVGGLAAGGLLSLLGLRLTRWESADGALHLTPNRWLVLLLTVVVGARILYGVVRTVSVVGEAFGRGSEVALVAESGLVGSLAAAGVFLGYYVGYWWGVRRRLRVATTGS